MVTTKIVNGEFLATDDFFAYNDNQMGKYEKLLAELLGGRKDQNLNFMDVRHLLKRLGGEERVRGDHYIISFSGCPENINLQPRGNKMKPYQAKQIRDFLREYDISLEDEEDV